MTVQKLKHPYVSSWSVRSLLWSAEEHEGAIMSGLPVCMSVGSCLVHGKE